MNSAPRFAFEFQVLSTQLLFESSAVSLCSLLIGNVGADSQKPNQLVLSVANSGYGHRNGQLLSILSNVCPLPRLMPSLTRGFG